MSSVMVALPVKLWREVREAARAERRTGRGQLEVLVRKALLARKRAGSAARKVAAAIAVAILPGCADGFGPHGFHRAGDWPDAGAPVWFKHPNAASALYVRATEARDSAQEAVMERYRAGIITPRETELALTEHDLTWSRFRLEVLKGPNGPAYAAELERAVREAGVWTPRPELYDLPNLIARDEQVIEGFIRQLTTGRDPLSPPPGAAPGDPLAEDCADEENECGHEYGPQFGGVSATVGATDIGRDGWYEVIGGGRQATVYAAEHRMAVTVGSQTDGRGGPDATDFAETWPFGGWTYCQNYFERSRLRVPRYVEKGQCEYICPFAESQHEAASNGATASDASFAGGAECGRRCGHDSDCNPFEGVPEGGECTRTH